MPSSDRRGRPSQDDEPPRRGSLPEDLRDGASADGLSVSSILKRAYVALDPPASASEGDPADLADSDPDDADMDHHESADSDTDDEVFSGPRPRDDAMVPIQDSRGSLDGDDNDLSFTSVATAWDWDAAPDTEDADHPWADRRALSGCSRDEDFADPETLGWSSSAASSSDSSDRGNEVVLRMETPPQASWRSTSARGASPPRDPDDRLDQVAFHWPPPAPAWGHQDTWSGSFSPPSPRATPETQPPLAPPAPASPSNDIPGDSPSPGKRSRVFWIALGVFLPALAFGLLIGASMMGPTGRVPPSNPWGDVRPGKTYYDVLGVPADATDEQIHAQHRMLVRAHHPDKLRVSATDPRRAALEEEANAKVREINSAYQGLSGVKRCHYDFFVLYLTSTRTYLECEMRWRPEHGAEERFGEGAKEDEQGVEVDEEEKSLPAATAARVTELLRPVAKRAAEVAVVGHRWWWSVNLEAFMSKLAAAIGVAAGVRSCLYILVAAGDGRGSGGT